MIASIVWDVDPILFKVGSWEVRWYGLMWGLGFILAYEIVSRLFKKEKYPEDWVDKLFVYCIVSTVSEIVHSVLSDNTNRRVTAIEETATKAATPSTAKQPKKKTGTPRKNTSSATSAPAIPSDNELAGKTCPLCGKGTIIKGKTAYGCSEWKNGCTYRKSF